MPDPTPPERNWFDQGGSAYALYRPDYPAQLAEWLAEQAPDRTLAVDVGCGNGQLTQLLAAHFEQVAGFDPSADQIANATPATNIDYRCAPAERIPVADASASLITAAQAAHWFDLPRFYSEARRIAAPGALLALVSYGVLSLEPTLDARFRQFYYDEIGPYWPPERKLVDDGYATLDFPFDEFAAPPMRIDLSWDLAGFLGYVSTWSATRAAREAGQQALLTVFAGELAALWGDPANKRPLSFPINMRIGRIHRT